MKTKIFIIMLLAIMFLPIINVSAECYKKCETRRNGQFCDYSRECVEETCEGKDESCVKVSCYSASATYCGNSITKVSCGNITDIPEKIPELTSFVIMVIQIAIPVILVIFGTLDLFKGITAGKEDEMKKGQQMFIKRLIVGALIFFVVVIVKFVISIVADSTSGQNITECIDCFLSGVENCRR